MDYFKRVVFLVLSILVFTNCGGGGSGSTGNATVTSEPSQGNLYPSIIKDINPDPNIVEVNLTAEMALIKYAGFDAVDVYSYNGIIPGPTIEAKVGDKIIVHFKNQLPESTTVHWHGLELPANMDGSNIAQTPILTGKSFTYTFKVTRAATYWYHPHERSNIQVELGLHGVLIVRDNKEDKLLGLPTGINENLLVLDDVSISDLGTIKEEYPVEPYLRSITQLNGREGNVLMVNGQVNPKIKLKRGVPVRFRVVNAANARFMRLSISGHQIWRIGGDAGLLNQSIRKKEIGRIFNPAYLTYPAIVPEIVSDPDTNLGIFLTPGERAEFIFTPMSDLNEISLDWHDMNRGRHKAVFTSQVITTNDLGHGGGGGTATSKPYSITQDPFDGGLSSVKLATFQLFGSSNVTPYEPPQFLRPVSKLDENLVVGAPINLTFGHSLVDQKTGDVTFFIKVTNNPAYDPITNPKVPKMLPLPFDQVTSALADKVRPNETKIISITNETGGDHNFHLHGFMFQLLDTQQIDDAKTIQDRAIPTDFTEFKDTILVPRRLGKFGTTRSIIRLIVKFDDRNREGQIYAKNKIPTKDSSGGWVMHCHFLEHAERGMMSFIEVLP